jgi:predicted permease
VAVVNRQLVRDFFPNTNPLGQTFTTDLPDKGPITIVGICGDVKYNRVDGEIQPTYYVPYRQQGDANGGMGMTYEISTRLQPVAVVPALRAAVASVDKNLPLLDIRTQKEQIDATMREQQVMAELAGAFGILALTLASIGIYGIMAYSVSRRTNEIGIRMALGAQPAGVRRMVLGEASWMVVIGVAIGLAGALLLGRVIASMLYGLNSWDPATFATASALLILVALGASWFPARRAANVDPIRALRHE